ncbi:SGNH/GDSL hydrolase family protein [Tumidithrix helvetica PCC 7403]|uniref:SGNH/GDSL hydrolase family protein n=1 Tax=Tumidithrix helvetica TaxID=3457545 RepID=UPI003C84FDE4
MVVKIRYILVAVLILGLCGSIGLNILLYLRGVDLFLQLNRVRLDPLGLQGYTPINERETIASDRKPVVIFFGDSRAFEWTPPQNLLDSLIVNRGINGQTSIQVAGRFDAHITPLRPKVMVLQVGVNDLKTIALFPNESAQIVRNCKEHIKLIVDRAKQHNIKIILTTIFPVGEPSLEWRLFWSEEVDRAIAEVNQYILSLKGDRVIVLDTTPILANPQGRVQPDYSRDFLHLNAEGYAALNRQLAPILSDLLR